MRKRRFQRLRKPPPARRQHDHAPSLRDDRHRAEVNVGQGSLIAGTLNSLNQLPGLVEAVAGLQPEILGTYLEGLSVF
jgi:hypothetical protein